MVFLKTKYKMIFLKKLGESNFQKMGQKKFKLNDEVVTFEDKTFPLSEEMYCYLDGKTSYVFADYDNEKIIKFNNSSIGIDAKMLDKLLTTSKIGIIGQLMNSLKLDMKNKSDWKQYLSPMLIFVVGAVMGYMAGAGGII